MTEKRETITFYPSSELKAWLEEEAKRQSLRLKRSVSMSRLICTVLEQYYQEKEQSYVNDNRNHRASEAGARKAPGGKKP